VIVVIAVTVLVILWGLAEFLENHLEHRVRRGKEKEHGRNH
jgi:hypothetical protein